MITETKKVFALAALIVATGVVTVELTRNRRRRRAAIMTRTEAYAAARVDTAFDLVATMPERPAVMVPMAQRATCRSRSAARASRRRAGRVHGRRLRGRIEPSVVVETREGTTSTLMRMDPMTLAGVTDQALQLSE